MKVFGELETFRNEDHNHSGKTQFLCLGSIKDERLFAKAPGLRLMEW